MKRTMFFDVIQDTRFSKTANIVVNEWVQNILANLAKLPVTFNVDNMRAIPFGEPEPCTSYRQRIYVKKAGKISWQAIMAEINKTKSAQYEFLKTIKL
jgi:hypothetical protein